MSDPAHYIGPQGQPYEDPGLSGFLTVDMLQQLWGQSWNDVSLDLVSALEPTWIRVIRYNCHETSDGISGRVTIYLDAHGLIKKITKACRVGLRGPYQNGYELSQMLTKIGAANAPL